MDSDVHQIDRVLVKKLMNLMVSDYVDVFLMADDQSRAIKLLELLLYFDLKCAYRYLKKCVKLIVLDGEMLLRANSIAKFVLCRFVEICLDDLFDKYYKGNDIISECFMICSNAPTILRTVCHYIFNTCRKVNENDSINMLGFRAVSLLVIFEFYIGKILKIYKNDPVQIMECNKIKNISKFDKDANVMMMSLIKMLTCHNIGTALILKNDVVDTVPKNLIDITQDLELLDSMHCFGEDTTIISVMCEQIKSNMGCHIGLRDSFSSHSCSSIECEIKNKDFPQKQQKTTNGPKIINFLEEIRMCFQKRKRSDNEKDPEPN